VAHWLSHRVPWFLGYCLVALTLLALRAHRTFGPIRVPTPENEVPPSPDVASFAAHRRFADFYGAGVLNDFYEQWMPLLPLALLCRHDPVYWMVAVGHVLAFRGPLRRR
jgi:hypothetical protein